MPFPFCIYRVEIYATTNRFDDVPVTLVRAILPEGLWRNFSRHSNNIK
jgi:hypothetical protein